MSRFSCCKVSQRVFDLRMNRTDTKATSETDNEAILFRPFQFILSRDKLATNVFFVACTCA